MKAMLIMRGWPGCGKSTYARQIAKQLSDTNPDVRVFSTDDYFMIDGEYKFDPAKIVTAHQWNIQRCDDFCRDHSDGVAIVDNTNIKVEHMQPYIDIAAKYNAKQVCQVIPYSVQVVSRWGRNTTGVIRDFIDEVLDLHASRNAHGVPDSVVRNMYETWEDIDLPIYPQFNRS